MPNYRPYQNRLSDRYERRAKSVGNQTAKHRGRVAKILYKGLQDATQDELYNRTTLPVTRAMFNSIRPKIMGAVVQIGYFYGRGAKYAKYRVNMTGRSKQDGHKLDMKPSLWFKRNGVDRDIKRSEAQALKAIRETR